MLAWRLRGEVQSALLGGANWLAAPRSSAELYEAGRCLQRATILGRDELPPADKEAVVRQAVACLRAAQVALEAESMGRASSGCATPTGGDAMKLAASSEWSIRQDRELEAWVRGRAAVDE